MIVLSKEQVITLHEQLIAETGGISGLRDEGILESALYAPFQTFGNVEPYPSLQQKAARLGFGLIMDHPFIDGNKRTGTHTMLVFLALNNIDLEYTQQELSETIMQIAAGNYSFEYLFKWIINHQVATE